MAGPEWEQFSPQVSEVIYPTPTERMRTWREQNPEKASTLATRVSRERRDRLGLSTYSHTLPFVGVDGEGGNLLTPEGILSHEYLMLKAGGDLLQTGDPLTWRECLGFLADLPTGATYVSYFFNYDVSMMLRRIPPAKVYRLLHRETRQARDHSWLTFPVDLTFDDKGGGFQVDYLPSKELKVRRMQTRGEGLAPTHTPWVVVSDVGAFFQCSFLKALTLWNIGTVEEREAIGVGKAQRADFGELSADTIRYNALEIRLLQDLMEAFRAVCLEVGYVPSRWQGPGNLAVAAMKRHRVPPTREYAIKPEVAQAANDAYYGGRFETTAVGTIPGPVYQYDINSAYPYAMTLLPCLKHGRWVDNGKEPASHDRLTLHYGGYRPLPGHDEAMLMGFPVRTLEGRIYFPRWGAGWYWSPEIVAAPHQQFGTSRSWLYLKECDCEPFAWVPDVYSQRVGLGKTGRGIVLKLLLNSLYGKQAQSVGSAPYANPIYAGLITAITRGHLATLAHSGPSCCSDVFMLATDGIFTGMPRPTVPDKALGGWDLDIHPEGMFIVQPGLYFTSSNTMPKTRGMPTQVAVEHEAQFREAFVAMRGAMDIDLGKVNIGVDCGDAAHLEKCKGIHNFTGLRIASHRGDMSLAGQWVDTPRTISMWWGAKRDDAPITRNGIMRTYPREGSPLVVSVPYSKDIGKLLDKARLDEGWDQGAQPDWADIIFNAEEVL
jgi:DNA polymerase type B, organellar and viral